MSTINPEPETASIETSEFSARVAFERTALQRAGLEPEDFASLTVDAGFAVNTVMLASTRIATLREQIATLPVDHKAIDALYEYALATAHAVAIHKVATAPPEDLEPVYADALERRGVMKSDASNLAVHGLLNRDSVASLKGETGYRNVAYELLALVSMFRAASANIIGRSGTLPVDIDKAEAIGNRLLKLSALRDQRRNVDPTVIDNRIRAFTLMHNAYEEARRAVEFLRWYYGDADDFAPSFYGQKSTRRRDDVEIVPVPVVNTTGDAPSATVPGNVPPATSGSPVPGGRGGSPFA